MKAFVKIGTAISFVLILLGGSALDSTNITAPILIMSPGFAWFGMMSWVNR